MGREVASTFARWCALLDMPVRPELVAVADLNAAALDWFRQIPSVRLLTTAPEELITDPEIEVVYAAVPHDQHEDIYLRVLHAGKDLLAEKPFGIDLDAAIRIAEAAEQTGRFVRCSSEFPFLPGVQRVVELVRSGACGRILDVVSGFHHSSDLDPSKPANWKRRSAQCGEIGVMGDLGIHVCHVPFRLGWFPRTVFAQLQRGYPERPDGKGGTATCDTWDNAMLHTWVDMETDRVPVRFEMRRLAPGATNTWFIEVQGTNGGVRFSTAEPKSLWIFERGREQAWKRVDLGFSTPFRTITGGIFEVGFPDLLQQMWAAFLLEREGVLGERFGCVTPTEAVASHRLFHAALASQAKTSVVNVGSGE